MDVTTHTCTNTHIHTYQCLHEWLYSTTHTCTYISITYPHTVHVRRGSKEIHLAVLHPRDVVVYSLTSLSSDDPSGLDQSLADQTSTDQYQLTPAYKNPLTRTACNMTFGPFVQETKKQGKYICILQGKYICHIYILALLFSLQTPLYVYTYMF